MIHLTAGVDKVEKEKSFWGCQGQYRRFGWGRGLSLVEFEKLYHLWAKLKN